MNHEVVLPIDFGDVKVRLEKKMINTTNDKTNLQPTMLKSRSNDKTNLQPTMFNNKKTTTQTCNQRSTTTEKTTTQTCNQSWTTAEETKTQTWNLQLNALSNKKQKYTCFLAAFLVLDDRNLQRRRSRIVNQRTST